MDPFGNPFEEMLITGDVGVDMTERIHRIPSLPTPEEARTEIVLKMFSSVLCEMVSRWKETGQPIRFLSAPTVVLLVGVMVSGKNDHSGQNFLEYRAGGQESGPAAADTFRAGLCGTAHDMGGQSRCAGGCSRPRRRSRSCGVMIHKAVEAEGTTA
jgi:signal recognition particle GTPase